MCVSNQRTVFIYNVFLFLLWNTNSFSQSATIVLKGDDFKQERTLSLRCEKDKGCITYRDTAGKHVMQMELKGSFEDRVVTFNLMVVQTPGKHKIRLDKDADQKTWEYFGLEIAGPNAPVDIVVYTVENPADEVIIEIQKSNEKTGQFEASFTAKIIDPQTGNKKATMTGKIGK